MKQKFYLLVLVLLGMVFGSQRANAQYFDEYGNVVWIGSNLDDLEGKYVYLYIPGHQTKSGNIVTEDKGFLSGSGSYGVQMVLNTFGTRLKVAKRHDANNYDIWAWNFITPELNPYYFNNNPEHQCFLSPNNTNNDRYVYIDRVDNPNWLYDHAEGDTHRYTETIDGEDVTGYEYRLYCYGGDNGSYYHGGNRYFGEDGQLTTQANAVYVRFITEQDYKRALDNITIGDVDLAAYVSDPTFEFYNKDGADWEWRNLGATPEETGALIDPYTPNTPNTYYGIEYTPDEYNGKRVENLTGTTENLTRWHQRNQTWMVNGFYNKEVNDGNTDIPNRQQRIGYNLGFGNNNALSFNGLWREYAQYFAAEIYNEAIEFSQQLKLSTLEQLNGGLYKITVEALYDDGGSGTTNQISDGTPNAVLFYRAKVGDKVTYREVPLPVIGAGNMGTGSTQILRHSGVSAGRELVRDLTNHVYQTELYMLLEANAEVRIGVRVKEPANGGWTVFNNVHLYALGQTPLLVNENWELAEKQIEYYQNWDRKHLPGVDPYYYTSYPVNWYDGTSHNDPYMPTSVYYTRTMTKGKWNTICLPFALNPAQIKAAFGEDCKLSEFAGLNESGSCILFKTATVNEPTSEAYGKSWNDPKAVGAFKMVIGKPYLIKPTVDPQILDSTPGTPDSYRVPWSRAKVSTGNYVEIESPAYIFPNVLLSQTYEREYPDDVPEAGYDRKGDITFEGNFYKTTVGKSTSEYDNWVITQGNMYHLTNDKDFTLWATYAYLHAPSGIFNTNEVQSIAIEDGDTYINTAVEGLMIDYDGTVGNNEVYTLGGQKVSGDSSISNLKKGVYIMNGKKYVVR